MPKPLIEDELWAHIEPLLPKKRRRKRYAGRRALSDRHAHWDTVRATHGHSLEDAAAGDGLRHLIVEGDLSAYGLVNAVTHFLHDVEDYDRATEFEALGGKLIELSSSDWRELVEAA